MAERSMSSDGTREGMFMRSLIGSRLVGRGEDDDTRGGEVEEENGEAMVHSLPMPHAGDGRGNGLGWNPADDTDLVDSDSGASSLIIQTANQTMWIRAFSPSAMNSSATSQVCLFVVKSQVLEYS